MKLQTANSEALRAVRTAAESGLSPEVSVVRLHDMGFSVVGSMRIIREAYKISLAEAKRIVAGHPVWKSLAEKTAALHNEFERCAYDSVIFPEVESVSAIHSRG